MISQLKKIDLFCVPGNKKDSINDIRNHMEPA